MNSEIQAILNPDIQTENSIFTYQLVNNFWVTSWKFDNVINMKAFCSDQNKQCSIDVRSAEYGGWSRTDRACLKFFVSCVFLIACFLAFSWRTCFCCWAQGPFQLNLYGHVAASGRKNVHLVFKNSK